MIPKYVIIMFYVNFKNVSVTNMQYVMKIKVLYTVHLIALLNPYLN